MANYLGIMSVKLGADYATLQSDLGKAAMLNKRYADDMAKKFTEVGTQLGKALGVGLVAGSTAILALTKSAINSADELAKMSQKVGVSTESLSALKHQAGLAGVEIEGMQTGLVKFNKSIAEGAGGAKKQADTFAAMGVALKDANGSIKDTDKLLAEVADKFAMYEDGAAKTAIAVQLFGRAGADMIPLLNGGAKAMAEAAEEAAQLGKIIGTETAKQAEEFNDNMSRAADLATGFGNVIAASLLPNLVALTDQFVKGAKEGQEFREAGESVATTIKYLGGTLIITYEVLKSFGNLLAAVVETIVGLGDIGGSVLTNLGYAVTGLAKAIAGDLAGASADFALAGTALAEGWERGVTRIKTTWAAASENINENMANSKAAFDALVEPIEEVNKRGKDFENVIGGIVKLQAPIIETGEAATGAAAAVEKFQEVVAGASEAVVEFQYPIDETQQYIDELTTASRLLGLTTSQQRVETTVMRALADVKRKNAQAGKELVKIDEQRIRQAAQLNNAMDLAASINVESPFDQLIEDAETLGETIRKGIQQGWDPMLLKPFQDAQDTLNETMQDRNMALLQEGVSSLQQYAKEGTAAYTALGIAQDILAYKSALTAIATQGGGDPYTAFARIAAMIALMASIGIRVGGGGGSGGPSASSAEVRQAAQGTGTVLGDSSAKSESIANAVEITANATSELVGINRNMLTALQSLQDALGAAGGMLARGVGDVDFGPAGGSGLFLGLFGDSRKIIDEGIIIAGGALNDMLDNIVVGAYQTIQRNGGFFGSSSTGDRTEDITDEFGHQFELIMESIADTVREGALSLGILPAEIEAALAAYQVEEIRISLEDLSIEEQQAELAAVFSSIFDGLAADVVPFIEQFQQVGEGLGETLVRVATGVQVMHEAISQLGFALDESDPERFAQASEGLIGAAGGLDQFISQMQSFVSTFTDDARQFEIATTAINSAFDQAGLTVPATADSFGALMQTLDATTASGQEQIATLLRLSSTAKEYYDTLEEFQKLPGQLMEELGQSGGFTALRGEIEAWERDTVASLNALGRAMGQQGAAEQDLVNVHQVAAQRIAQLIAKLKEEMRELAVSLGYVSEGDTLESLNAQIEALGTASTSAGDAIGAAVDGMREKMNLLLGDLSPFNDQRKLQLALEGLSAGTVDPEQVLEIGRRLYASSSQYTALFNQVMGTARFGADAMDGSGSESSAEGRTLAELTAARDALLAAARPDLADDLAHRIAEIAYATGDEFAAIAAEQGFTLEQLGSDLGYQGEELNAYLEQLVGQFEAQDFGTIVDAVKESTDRIVAAITGNPVETAIQASDDRMTQISAEQLESRAASDKATIEAINNLTSAVVASGAVNAERLVTVLDQTRRDISNMGAEIRDNSPRGVRIFEQIR